MFKKTLIAGAVLAATTGLAFANGGTYVEPPHHTGAFYLGAGVSGDFAKFDTEIDLNGTRFAEHELGGAGVGGTIFGGYGLTFQDHYYLGLELFGDYSSAEATDDTIFASIFSPTDVTSNKVELRWSWGVAARAGVKVNDNSLLYIRGGYIRSQFRFGGVDNFAGAIVGVDTSDKEWFNGLQVGGGLETALTNNVSIGIEYDANIYRDRERSEVFTIPGVPGVHTVTASVDPLVQQVVARISYYFTGLDDLGMHHS